MYRDLGEEILLVGDWVFVDHGNQLYGFPYYAGVSFTITISLGSGKWFFMLWSLLFPEGIVSAGLT